MSERYRPGTLAAQALGAIDEATRALVPPIHLASTFLRDPDNLYRSGNVYGRPDNPTVREAEAVIGALEGAAETLVFGSGMSAAVALFLSLGPGAHAVAPTVMYWALRNWLAKEAPALGVTVDFVDAEDFSALAGHEAGRHQARLARDAEQSALGGQRHRRRGARSPTPRGRFWPSNSTCATPVFTRPLEPRRRRRHAFGDQVPERPFRRDRRRARLSRARRAVRARAKHPQGARAHPASVRGVSPDPGAQDARPARARLGAERVEARPSLRRASPVPSVLYPGLPHHPGHETALADAGRVRRHAVDPGQRRRDAAVATAARARLWKRATSLGGVESLIEHRASIEGEGSPCPPDLLRLSAGIEDFEDLWRDLDGALRG